MNNLRRRKELLTLSIMLATSATLIQSEAFKQTFQVAYKYLTPLDQLFKNAVPLENDRSKEIRKAQMVVNAIVPREWSSTHDEWRLWFVAGLIMRLVASGWKAGNEPQFAEFIQSMYHLSQNFDLKTPPPARWTELLAAAPDKLRKQGVFLS